MGDDLLAVPLSAQGAVAPLLGIETRQVLRKPSPFGAHQRPEVVIPESRHIARCPSYVRESQLLVDRHRALHVLQEVQLTHNWGFASGRISQSCLLWIPPNYLGHGEDFTFNLCHRQIVSGQRIECFKAGEGEQYLYGPIWLDGEEVLVR